jgi:hypothetical protein
MEQFKDVFEFLMFCEKMYGIPGTELIGDTLENIADWYIIFYTSVHPVLNHKERIVLKVNAKTMAEKTRELGKRFLKRQMERDVGV